MKLFCAYAFTGEDLDVVTKRMRLVIDTLNANGHEAYCNRFDEVVYKLQANDDTKGVFKLAFQKVKEAEAMVAIITSPKRSIGQIMEIGTALSAGMPVYLFEHASVAGSSYLPKLVDKHFTWDTTEDLVEELKKI